MEQNRTSQKPSFSFVCAEDWNKMSLCEQGRFCGSCQKTIIDFTQKSDAEIQEKLSKHEGKICGRFYNYQLAKESRNKISFRRFLSPFLVFIGFSCQTNEQYSTVIGILEPPLSNQTSKLSQATDSINSNNYSYVTSEIDTNAIYVEVEKMPEYKFGGEQGLIKFLKENVENPSKEKEGIVVCRFIIDRNGNVMQPEILKSLSVEADKETLRILNLLQFNPGKQNGQKVKVQHILPIRFKNN